MTVLANEQVIDGKRLALRVAPVEQRELTQWFLQDHGIFNDRSADRP